MTVLIAGQIQLASGSVISAIDMPGPSLRGLPEVSTHDQRTRRMEQMPQRSVDLTTHLLP